jgi:D-alanyl-D-alanine dipeptidase
VVAMELIPVFTLIYFHNSFPDMTNNLSIRFCILKSCLLIFSTFLCLQGLAQDSGYTRPPLTDKWDDYKKQVKDDPSKKMMELKELIPGIVYDLRYATKNNFMRRLMYPAGTSSTFLRLPAAIALQKVQQELNAKSLGLKIYDAYRPYSVIVKFWELVKDERYVANPSRGSGHNRGVAVDLTIINIKTGKELDMGTGFDNFSDTAHHTFKKLSVDVLTNRELLRTTMERSGFRTYTEEWWHYSWPESGKYEILDIDFKKFIK